MFANSIKFWYTRRQLNQTLLLYISTTPYQVRKNFNFSRNSKNEVAETLYNQQQPTFAKKCITNRTYSRCSSVDNIIGKPKHIASKEEYEEFMSLFPSVVADFIEIIQCADIPKVSRHIETVLNYNVSTGKKFRGLGFIAAYKIFESPEKLNAKHIRLANILGWCIEIMGSWILLFDDIVDQAETRRETTCWYKIKGVGFGALNDGIVLENGLYMILQKYFANHPNYVQILETFHCVSLKTLLGQCLDFMCTMDGEPNFECFTMESFKAITKYKTSYYTIYLPIALAMHLAQKPNEDLLRQTNDIILKIGECYQIQNDLSDCFVKPQNPSKKGNDICEGKCTWLAVAALERANPEQKKLFMDHYGQGNNDKSEQIVRNLYEELELLDIYTICTQESRNLIRSRLEQIPKDTPLRVLLFKYLKNM